MLNLATCIKSLIMHGTESHVTVVNLCFLLSQLPTTMITITLLFQKGGACAPPCTPGLSCYCLHFLYFWLNKRLFFSGYFIRRISGTIKRFWCIRYGTNIEVKIRDCPGAFGTDGGSDRNDPTR